MITMFFRTTPHTHMNREEACNLYTFLLLFRAKTCLLLHSWCSLESTDKCRGGCGKSEGCFSLACLWLMICGLSGGVCCGKLIFFLSNRNQNPRKISTWEKNISMVEWWWWWWIILFNRPFSFFSTWFYYYIFFADTIRPCTYKTCMAGRERWRDDHQDDRHGQQQVCTYSRDGCTYMKFAFRICSRIPFFSCLRYTGCVFLREWLNP